MDEETTKITFRTSKDTVRLLRTLALRRGFVRLTDYVRHVLIQHLEAEHMQRYLDVVDRFDKAAAYAAPLETSETEE